MTSERERRPTEIEIGQRWGFWVFEDSLYEQMVVQSMLGKRVFGRNAEGNPCATHADRLLETGDYLGKEEDLVTAARGCVRAWESGQEELDNWLERLRAALP